MDWPALITAFAALAAAVGGGVAAVAAAKTHRKAGAIEVAVNGSSVAAAAELKRVHSQLDNLRKELAAVQQARLEEAKGKI